MDVRLAPLALLAGLAAGVGAVAVHQPWWQLLIAAAATLAVVVAAPPGWWTRLPFALAFAGVAVRSAVPRGAGDYLLGSTGSGYAVLVLALVVLSFAVATLPKPGRSRPGPVSDSSERSGGSPTPE